MLFAHKYPDQKFLWKKCIYYKVYIILKRYNYSVPINSYDMNVTAIICSYKVYLYNVV